jgi:hypothetical protein
MGRPRKHHSDRPPRFFVSHGAFYHVVRGKWHPLGRDERKALQEYYKRELEGLSSDDVTFVALRSAYLADGTKHLAPRTVKDYTKYLEHLGKVFDAVVLSDIEPHHVRKYHRRAVELRGTVQANREKACLPKALPSCPTLARASVARRSTPGLCWSLTASIDASGPAPTGRQGMQWILPASPAKGRPMCVDLRSRT